MHGSYSSSGYGCDNGISLGLLLTAALGIAVMFYTLYTKITMAGRRRRKRSPRESSEIEENMEIIEEEVDPLPYMIDHMTDLFFSGQYRLTQKYTHSSNTM